MVARKKRLRYRRNAIKLANENHIRLDPDDWEAVWAVLDQFDEPVYLYAIVDVRNCLVKFGKSVSPGMRRNQLQTATGAELKIWAMCEQKFMTEKAVHAMLAPIRISGEWFRLNETSRTVINEMRRFSGARLSPENRRKHTLAKY